MTFNLLFDILNIGNKNDLNSKGEERMFEEKLLKIEEEMKESGFKDLIAHIESPDYSLKINNWANKFGIPVNKVKEKILSDSLFAYNFIKDFKKQNFVGKITSEIFNVKQ